MQLPFSAPYLGAQAAPAAPLCRMPPGVKRHAYKGESRYDLAPLETLLDLPRMSEHWRPWGISLNKVG